MPIIRQSDAEKDSGNPPATGPFEALLYSDSGGLTQFGAFVETLAPGSRSSIKHWHAHEDEFVYVLEGRVTLHEGAVTAEMGPGDAACFPAGAALGHCLENRSPAPVRYLVVGTRAPRDTVTYPDHDRILQLDRDKRTRIWTDHAGAPASTPYTDSPDK